MRALRFAPVAIAGLIVAALVWRLANPPDSAIQSQMIGSQVPDIEATAAMPGKPAFTSASLSDGRPKLVNFFASWCVPCIAEAPVLAELKRRGVTIVGIAVRDRPEDVAGFLAEHGDPFEAMVADPESKLQLAFGSAGVPETFLVDGRGIIRMEHIGPVEADDVPELVNAVESAR
ncbi:MAG TPA: DsbE family thiol:disulfide interchange protein [Sphingomicrobium sp.]|nr:DsbE family thiol:disulfide interchange protein [Sphingomicrobium sp.]